MKKMLLLVFVTLFFSSAFVQAGPVQFRRHEGFTPAGYKFITWTGDTGDTAIQQGAFKITYMVEGPEQGTYTGTEYGRAMIANNPRKLFLSLEEQYEREQAFGRPITLRMR